MGASSRSGRFNYQPLSGSREIRIIELQAGQYSDPIHCTIIHVSLDALPQYEALSYTWGDIHSRTTIMCSPGQAPLSITSSLDVTLRHLRWPGASRMLWVDAVCINQEDIAERGQQVQLMGEVYTQAQQVVAWVGEESETDVAVMELASPGESATATPNLGNFPMGAVFRGIAALSSFIKRPWFSRVWIIQEVALSTKLALQCGMKTLDWDAFVGAVQILFEISRRDRQLVKSDISLERIEFLKVVKAMTTYNRSDLSRTGTKRQPFSRFAFEGTEQDQAIINHTAGDLQFFVTGARLYLSTNERDHIYGLLGLVNELEKSIVVPTYEKPFPSVYSDFVKETIIRSGNLDILGQADSILNSDESLPSWCPDWRVQWRVDSLTSRRNRHYKASGDSIVRLGASAPQLLTVDGIFIDTIQELSMGLKPISIDNSGTSQSLLLAYMQSLLTKAGEQSPVYKQIATSLKEIFRFKDSDGNPISEEAKRTQKYIDSYLESVEPGLIRFLFRVVATEGLSNQEGNRQSPTIWIDVMKAFIQETLPTVENIFLGPVHPISWNNVQIPSIKEREWKKLAEKCKPYPSGEKFDDIYWRTLMGDRIKESSGKSIKPAPEWRDAYRVWIELISRNDGILPRLRKGKVTKIREQFHPLALDVLHIKRPPPEKPPESLLAYFRDRSERESKAHEKDSPSLLALRQNLDGIQSGKIDFRFSTSVSFATMMAPNPPPPKLPVEEYSKRIEEQPINIGEELQSASPNTSAQVVPQEHQEKQPDEMVEQSLGDNQVALKTPETHSTAEPESSDDRISTSRVGRTFERDVLRMATNRQFAITGRRYMGWVPVDAQKGDKICILLGGQVPFVLRPIQDGKYQLVGEAYLHGLMDGEGLSIGKRIEKVVLR